MSKFSHYVFFLLLIVISSFFISCDSTTAQHSQDEFKDMFDGKTLDGWKGDKQIWRVDNGVIIGQTTPEHLITTNTFLIYEKGQPSDFEMVAEFKISPEGNSGIQYRSATVDSIPFTLKGYQADIDGGNVYTGQNYEERGRGFLAKRGENAVLEKDQQPKITSMSANPDSLKSFIKSGDWNEIKIIAKGNRLTHFINGHQMCDVTDNDASLRKMEGLIGFQVHAGPPMKVEYRNVKIKN